MLDSYSKYIHGNRAELPYGIKRIEDKAFMDCDVIEEVIIPSTVVEIGWKAFQGCSALLKVVIPDSVRRIGE